MAFLDLLEQARPRASTGDDAGTTPCARTRIRGAARRRHGGTHPRHAEGGGRLRQLLLPTASSPMPAGRCAPCPWRRRRSRTAQLRQEGYRELVLTGIEISSWGRDLKKRRRASSTFLEAVSAAQQGICGCGWAVWSPVPSRRTSAAVPPRCPICVPTFHLSLQSGCDATLRRMNRKYDTGAVFGESVRAAEPCISHRPAITTDLIVRVSGGDGGGVRPDAGISSRNAASRSHPHLPVLHPPRYPGRGYGAGAARRQGAAGCPGCDRWRSGCTARIWRAAWGRCTLCCMSRPRAASAPATPPTISGSRRERRMGCITVILACEDHWRRRGDTARGVEDIMNHFFAYIDRMRYIERLGADAQQRAGRISRSTAIMVAVLAHALAVIRRRVFRRAGCDAGAAALQRRCTTTRRRSSPGDMPTPIKYFNPEHPGGLPQGGGGGGGEAAGHAAAGAAGPSMRTSCAPPMRRWRHAGEGGGQAQRPYQVPGGAEGRQRGVSGRRRGRRLEALESYGHAGAAVFPCSTFWARSSLTLD